MEYFAHAQAVCTRTLLGGEGPGNEASTYSANVTAFATPDDTCKQCGLILPNVDLTTSLWLQLSS